MPLLTTTIGAYPKPKSVRIPDWFDPGAMDSSVATRDYMTAIERLGLAALYLGLPGWLLLRSI